MRIKRDIKFAQDSGTSLLLDLYLPDADTGQLPVVVYLHAGGWIFGDRTFGAEARSAAMTANGIAVASVGYRLAPGNHYPDQLHDAQAAVRWLRANGEEFGLRTDRIGAWGISAGGQIAAMLGLTDGESDETVQAVVCYFATTDLVAASTRNELEREIVPAGSEAAYLGVEDVNEDLERARSASPRYHVSGQAPPFLLFHGDRDRVVDVDQSRSFHDALVVAGASSQLVIAGGAGHEADVFDQPAMLSYVAGFFAEHLASAD